MGYCSLVSLYGGFGYINQRKFCYQDNNLVISVENGTYSPAQIKLQKGHSAVLTFLRKDATPCAELVQFPELDISATLPLNTPVEINVPQLDEGEYKFHCQMQMYKGRLSIG